MRDGDQTRDRFARLASVLGLCVIAIIGAQAAAMSTTPEPATADSKVPTAQFVVFGDAGTSLPPQYAVGRAMAQVCAARGCDLGIELGDNFYPSGVTSLDDRQFQGKFEKPYAPLQFPIYVALGNHDTGIYGNGANNDRGDVQVQYAHSGRSTKFRMPARYYRFSVPAEPGERKAPFAEFFALDSSPMMASATDSNPEWDPQTYGAKQTAWFQRALKRSKATWKIAFAHHPYISNGEHGNAGHFTHPPGAISTATGQVWRRLLQSTVCRRNVDIFLAGHDHDMEWLKPVPVCGKTQFLISGLGGAGASALTGHNPYIWHVTYTYGFFWISLRQHEMAVAAYTLTPDLKLPVDENGRPSATFEETVTRNP